MPQPLIHSQQNPHLRRILTNVLTQIYFPLIPQVFNAGAANAGAIRFMIWPGESVQDMRPIINEGIGRMDLLIAPQTPLPPVNISDTDFGGVTYSLHDPNVRGERSYGLGAGPSQVMHEQGHHVENYLNVNEFANLHNHDHSFPLRSKAPKGMKHRCLSHSKPQFVRIGLRKQAHYRARGVK